MQRTLHCHLLVPHKRWLSGLLDPERGASGTGEYCLLWSRWCAGNMRQHAEVLCVETSQVPAVLASCLARMLTGRRGWRARRRVVPGHLISPEVEHRVAFCISPAPESV